MSETATNNKIYDKLTPQRKQLVDIILANLEKGVGLWKQGWLGGAPKSGITGKPYRGINRLFLSAATMEKGYSDNRWVTFNQMEDKGWSFKRNEEGESLGKGAGVAIEFYELRDKETKKPFDRRTLDGMTRAEQEEYMDENVYPIRKYYRVFNGDVIEGIPERVKAERDESGYSKRAEKIIGTWSDTEARIYFGGTEAFYLPEKDEIHVPNREAFFDNQEFYSTTLHEIGHSTGHKSRLNRNLNGGKGTPDYAIEELRAEIASMFIAQDLELTANESHIQNNSAYIQHWKSKITENPNVLFTAIADAEKITKFVMAKENVADNAAVETEEEFMETVSEKAEFDMLTVTAYNYTDNDNYKKNVRRSMLMGNFRPSTLYGLQIEGFKSANVSPISTLKNQERGINSSSLAAAFPFVRTFVMDEGGILLGENNKSGYPFIFNIWKRGNLYQNSNAMIIGKSGSGKSFFLKSLVLNEWANGTRVIMLDPEAEYLALTRNLYGNVINVGNAREGRINPFHIYKILTEDGTAADSKVTFNTHLKMLESFFKIVLADAPVDVIELINNLTVETYERMGITENTDCSNFPADYFPLFSDLLETLQSKDKDKMDSLTLRDMRTAELYLQKFVNGRYSDIWNAPSTLQVNSNLIDFDFQSLFANKNNVVANAQMLLVFRFIEQEVINAREKNRNGNAIRTMIVCDEAHLFIDAKFPIALDFFYSMSKRIRKYNGSFIPATQNIADWNANEELRGKTSAILKNSQYTFIFKLSAPDMKDVLDVYRTGDSFNDEEQRMIISAVTGQAFFVGSTELRACMRVQAGNYAKELFNDEKKEEGEIES